ncbi:cell division protein FtsW [Candidatus Uhrbacteria bacterium RIFCSPLOWO2_12_FULL_46_10]|uniref:Probable peptidoglycan glycosyltransferase FtsW n=1 Tax=Candidatus Uhrbacteria bacterium RIFCSPLOWO2_01_FULL_47_25 TaxID=1802402 RepID=A0A1F7UR73_9BACT|nr:MAG: Stage V sporulation protein E [Parcubacteria group bacterium GW2011_GWA2_46_9]OGL59207.1 MAG: cell division protein FtsW [Candidatus Uhrbacteria bacterium RIFCSPHIGHO2_01_FULL_46_23]OGL69161.1 MAG: cell division protein FtsW [Candidatus Uhrbacteria bacterium RIFCSPHIGHO2_02_FULL_47_29]OGL75558.1 MAG: cell division protein FtsW [Candidatus Uhrbacteria bacterium RIFCSPHIGHO2_12_FULL_46_13]OGL80224.1 MAG: cell division protein FtsW [Candidatus Uhrbacteria bacterium RIFCSPLOWO2_01_FULL_47_2
MKARQNPDYRLLAVLGVLLIFGLVMLSSASAVVGFDRFGDSYYFLKRQLIATGIGLLLFIFFLRFDYRHLKRFALPLFIASLLLLLLVFIPNIGQSYGTFARRWVRLGPITFQPSEIVKLSMLIYLSVWLTKRGRRINDFKLTFLPLTAIIAVVAGLIIIEPDIGTAFMIALIASGVYFLAGGRLAYLFSLVLIGMVVFMLLIQFKPHAADRFKIFLHPELDPKGIGYHINQAYLAIGSGGLFGRGFGQSRAKFQYLPEVYGDSIFAVVAEELGFIVVALWLALLLYFLFHGFKVSRLAPDDFGRLLGGGIILWITGQSLVNVSAMVGLLPLTGITLPFLSYGSSSMVVLLAAAGILANISTRRRDI